MDEMREKIAEITTKLIYHGRHFSPSRDAVVIDKSIEYILALFTSDLVAEEPCDNPPEGRTCFSMGCGWSCKHIIPRSATWEEVVEVAEAYAEFLIEYSDGRIKLKSGAKIKLKENKWKPA